ncbi:MAG: hypothetical protein AAF988_08855 [Pseudomonadota bacterium]
MERVQKAIQFLLAKENRVGTVILLVGLIAFLFVSVQALNHFVFSSGKSNQIEYDREEITTENFRNVSPEAVAQIRQRQQEAKRQEKLKYDRQQDILEASIQGSWQFNGPKFRYLLQLWKGGYKMILIPQKDSGERYRYSVGNYSLKKDVLILDPVRSYPKAREEFPGYDVLTLSRFPFLVALQGSRLVLQKPTRNAGVYVPPRHPVLVDIPDEVAVFSPLK